MHPARAEDDKSLTFLTKTDPRTWLASVQTKIALGQWMPLAQIASRRREETQADEARSIGLNEYSERWIEMIRTQSTRSGKKRAVGTVRAYKSKLTGYLIPQFGDTPIREIDTARIREVTDRLDQIRSPLNPRSKLNGITTPVLVVLMMILRQTVRDGIIPAAPDISIPKQPAVRHDADHDPNEDVASPERVEELYAAMPDQWAIGVMFAAWCQLRRAECLGLQRRDIESHDDGTATVHVRRQLNANTGDYTLPKRDAGTRSVRIPGFTTTDHARRRISLDY